MQFRILNSLYRKDLSEKASPVELICEMSSKMNNPNLDQNS